MTQPAQPVSPAAQEMKPRIPLDLPKVQAWPADIAEEVCWLHQHMHTNGLSYGDVSSGVGYSPSTLSRLFSGNYPGDLAAVAAQIKSWRELIRMRDNVEALSLVENRVAKKIMPALDFALANSAIVEIIGESGMGKTFCAEQWIKRGKHAGRVFYLMIPTMPAKRAVVDLLARMLGISGKYYAHDLFERIVRKLGPDQLIIVDEAIRLLPANPSSTPHGVEYLRDLHDRSGCGIAILTTSRWSNTVRSAGRRFMYEQWVGRCDLTVELPHEFTASEVRKFLVQFFPSPTPRLVEAASALCNSQRHVRDLKRVLNMAQRIAKKSGADLAEPHFGQAIKFLSMLANPKAGEDEA